MRVTSSLGVNGLFRGNTAVVGVFPRGACDAWLGLQGRIRIW